MFLIYYIERVNEHRVPRPDFELNTFENEYELDWSRATGFIKTVFSL